MRAPQDAHLLQLACGSLPIEPRAKVDRGTKGERYLSMTPEPQSVGNHAQALSDEERAGILEQLLATMSDDAEGLTDEQIAAELDRRRTEIEQGFVKPISWREKDVDR